VKKFLFSLLLISTSLFGQPDRNSQPFTPRLPFESEVISLPRTDEDFSVYYTYRIPYKLLVFERVEESYNASFRVVVEISDKDGKLVARDIKDSKISVNSFKATDDFNLFLQDYLSFKINPDDYKVVAIISDMNSTGDLPLKPVELKLGNNENNLVLNPLVINSQEIICNDEGSFKLANVGGNVPFSVESFDLVIPVNDTLITEIDVTLENNDEVIFSGRVKESYVLPIGITDCEDNILVTTMPENKLLRNFIIKNVNEKLNEGNLVLTIKNEEKEIDEKINLNVVWFNKPFSLLNPEKAIEFLSYIESDSVVSELLDEDESDYPKVLNNFWAKFDPTPETTFNEIMFEYYSRVDYAVREFRSITNNNGAKTDRGMVYIKFGNADKIERTSTSQGQVIEVWTYSKSQRSFSFIDKTGTGNFTLTEY
jgi:GWxTD domain-containing protein